MDLIGAATLIGSLTGMIAAIGALWVAVRNSRKADDAREKAIIAATRAEDAAAEAKAGKAEVVKVGKSVFEVGKQIDGRLSELLEKTERLAHAEGEAIGRSAERKEAGERAAGERMPNGGQRRKSLAPDG